MLQERGEVVEVEPGAVWVRTRRLSTCSACSARAGCGHALLDRLQNTCDSAYIRARCSDKVTVGDRVVIGIAEQAVVQGSLLVYVWPLLALMLGIWGAYGLGWSEPMMVLSGLIALGLAFWGVYRAGKRQSLIQSLEPEVISIEPGAALIVTG